MGVDLADVDSEHLPGFGAFDVGAAGRCVAAVSGLGVGAVGVVEISDVVGDEFCIGPRFIWVWTSNHSPGWTRRLRVGG